MRIVVIIPTYNEKDNIGPLIQALQQLFPSIPHDMHILVVDDDSPDGTAEAVRQERRRYANVSLMTGSKEGLGAAYRRGMDHALAVLRADAVMEMDADLSHKPADVPRLIAALDDGADFVIGSRYVPGGSIPPGWGLVRRMISRGGNLFARAVAGLYKVKDCTAGFRAIRASLLRKMDPGAIEVRGYAFQLALLHEAVMLDAVIREVPVDFVDRTKGGTKLGARDVLEFMLNAWWIRMERSRTFLKFAVVGATGVVVNLGSFTLLMGAGLSKFIASPLAIELSIISNFLLNNFWTFADRNTDSRIHIRGLKFNIVSLLSLAVSFTTFVVLSMLDPSGIPQVHQALGIVPATAINYFLNSYWTFKDTSDQAVPKP